MSLIRETTNTNKDSASIHETHVSHFGVLKAGPTIPVFKGNFPGSQLSRKQWIESTLNGGSVTVADGMAQLQCGTNSAGSIKVKSRLKGRFEAGQVTVYQAGVRAGTGLADNIRIWGLMSFDEQEGLYFKWNGTTFQAVARKAGVETAVDSGDFNGENDWTPADTNNTYRIEYSAGRAIFYRASGGKKVLLHEMVNTAEPLVNDLDLGVMYENTNDGNTTNVSMYVRGTSSSIWGNTDRHNDVGAQITTTFAEEVAKGIVPRYSIYSVGGYNTEIDTGTTPEDVWSGGGVYTGFNATAGEAIEVVSTDADDQGSVVSSGTATGGSPTTLIDSAATFQTDGAAAGDILLNDTAQAYGFIASVDSETQVTVYHMDNDLYSPIFNAAGQSYRIVNANDTGAAVVKLGYLFDSNYKIMGSEFVVLNGTTPVDTTGTDYVRCFVCDVIHAGSSGTNEGTITIRQTTTTANVFGTMTIGYGSTSAAVLTCPSDKFLLIKEIQLTMARASGAAGSATILLQQQPIGGGWHTENIYAITDSIRVIDHRNGGLLIPPRTNIRVRVVDVSDNDTIVSAKFEFYLLDEM